MASIEYKSSPMDRAGVRGFNVLGAQEALAKQGHLCNAIVIPALANVVHITGQVGNLESGEIPNDYRDEYHQAFKNVETVLQASGVKEGWKAVYKVHFLSLDLSTEKLQEWLKNIQTYCGDTRPTTMAIGANEIAWPNATLEIFVEAVHIP